MNRWRGVSPGREAFAMGIAHGAFCVGCCWSLMLVMFAVSTASLGWMLALGVVMAAEKNLSWGRRLSAPIVGHAAQDGMSVATDPGVGVANLTWIIITR